MVSPSDNNNVHVFLTIIFPTFTMLGRSIWVNPGQTVDKFTCAHTDDTFP